jgi:DNA/RNA endonuclease YhcR with UshA esterase domain
VIDNPHPAANCPSCGRFIGPQSRCPYCGADASQRLALRALKVGSLVLAVAGLAVLLLVARQSQTPAIQAGQVSGTMNWAFVRVDGLASRQPTYDPQARTLRFWVYDGTGEILVTAYTQEAEALWAEGRVPRMGDRVSAEGTLRIREDLAYLVLNAPQHLQVQSPAPLQVPIADVGTNLAYQRVTVRGMVRSDRRPYDGLRVLTLRDGSGEIDIVFAVASLPPGEDLPAAMIGQSVQATGAVDQYRGLAQISLGRACDLLVLEEAVVLAAHQPIAQITSQDVGHMASVAGVIVKVVPFSAGAKLQVEDGTGRVTVVLWQELLGQLVDREDLAAGATVHALGEIAEYRGTLEIVPEIPSDLEVVAPAEPVDSASQLAEPGAESVGPQVEVEGSLRSVQPVAAGGQGISDQDTGVEMTPLPMRPTAQPSWTPPVTSVLEATARPEPTATPRPQAEVRKIGQIGWEDLGRIVAIQRVTITEAWWTSGGANCRLSDGQHTIVLFMFQDDYEMLSPGLRHHLAPGTVVQVRGAVGEWAGVLEIVPRVEADLEVLATGQRYPLEKREIARITPADEGRWFRIEGKIVAVQPISKGTKLLLDDGTGQMVVLLWQNVYERVSGRERIAPGVRLQAAGQFDIWTEGANEFQIVPRAGKDVTLP